MMVEKEIPESLRSALLAGMSKLIDCERLQDWSCQSALVSDLELQGRKKTEWVKERKRYGSFFGKRLLKHRVEVIKTFGYPMGDDAHASAMIYGCAQLRGGKEGYMTFIEATREYGEWRFMGPYTVMQIDGPAERCHL
jgi:hypothetical protein